MIVLALIAPGLAACATQQGMTVDNSAVVNVSPKYRNAIAVRSVTGGRMMNAMTVMGVENEPLKAALEAALPPAAISPGPARQNSTSMPRS